MIKHFFSQKPILNITNINILFNENIFCLIILYDYLYKILTKENKNYLLFTNK